MSLYPRRSLLITGGAGFIGANFVHYWRRRYSADLTVVLDALTYAGNRNSLIEFEDQPGFRFVHGSINDEALVESLLMETAADTVVHFAAESHVDRSIVGPDAFIDTNVIGTHRLLKMCRKVWSDDRRARRFHHVSTDEVYGSLGPDEPPFTEKTPYAPNSPYAANKAGSDHLVRAYVHTYGLDCTTSNCSNNYGPFHFPEKLVPLTIVNILQGRPLTVYGDGRNVRDWLYVEDHCAGIDAVIRSGRAGETYNIGGRAERENIDVVRRICRLVDDALAVNGALREHYREAPRSRGQASESLIAFVADRPGHDRRYAIDATKIERELGFVAATSFDNGLRRTVEWFLHNEDWWRGVMDGRYRDWVGRFSRT